MDHLVGLESRLVRADEARIVQSRKPLISPISVTPVLHSVVSSGDRDMLSEVVAHEVIQELHVSQSKSIRGRWVTG